MPKRELRDPATNRRSRRRDGSGRFTADHDVSRPAPVNRRQAAKAAANNRTRGTDQAGGGETAAAAPAPAGTQEPAQAPGPAATNEEAAPIRTVAPGERCPRCATRRIGAFRFCRSCAWDYDAPGLRAAITKWQLQGYRLVRVSSIGARLVAHPSFRSGDPGSWPRSLVETVMGRERVVDLDVLSDGSTIERLTITTGDGLLARLLRPRD